MADELIPTSVAEWRRPRDEGFLVTLPSGNVARLRPVPLDMLVVAGEVPDILTPIAARAIWGLGEGEDDEAIDERTFEDAVEYIEFINLIVRVSMVEPRICEVDEAIDDSDVVSIQIDDVEFIDREMIQRLALLPASQMRRFRDRQEAGLETLLDSESDESEAE